MVVVVVIAVVLVVEISDLKVSIFVTEEYHRPESSTWLGIQC